MNTPTPLPSLARAPRWIPVARTAGLLILLLGLSACADNCSGEDCKDECMSRCFYSNLDGEPEDLTACSDACIADECVFSVRVPQPPAEPRSSADAGSHHDEGGPDAGFVDSGYTPPEEPDAGINEACIEACTSGQGVPECNLDYNCCFRFCHS